MFPVLTLLPLLALLAMAAVIDFKARRIPNWLTFALLLSGLMRPLLPVGHHGFADAGLGFLVGFTILFIPFCFGVAGGGDVKMIAGLGAWLGPVGIVLTIAIVYLIESAYVLTCAAYRGRLTALLNNTLFLLVELIHSRRIKADEGQTSGVREKTFRSLGRRLPYAVPTLIGAAIVICKS